jgi:glycosyltransferase involved in cell wall biosynthesis
VDPLVSIVVPSYNRRDGLGRLLDALARQTYPLDGFEVVVVDDGSTDGTAEYLAALRPAFPFRFLQQANQGPAAARNLGVRIRS